MTALGRFAFVIWLAALLPIAFVPNFREHAFLVIALLLVSGAAHVLLVRGVVGPRSMRPFVFLGIALRLVFLIPAVGFSDDFYRYAWEGRVVVAGANPYAHPPSDPALSSLRDEVIWPNVTHAEVPAAYPPLAEASFALAALTPQPVLALRLWHVACDLLAWFLLARLLQARGLDPVASILYGLSPLVLVEYAGSQHLDSAAIAATLLAMLFKARGRPNAATATLAIATLFKPYAIVLFPIVAIERFDGFRDFVRITLRFLLLIALVTVGYLPFAREGTPLAGIVRYATEWSFNAPFYPALRVLIERIRDHAFDAHWTDLDPLRNRIAHFLFDHSPETLARSTLLCAFLVIGLRTLRVASAEGATAMTLAALLLCSPTIQPWYVTWFLPYLAFRGGGDAALRFGPLWLWVVLAPLAHHVLDDLSELGVWREDVRIRIAQYAPVLLWIASRASLRFSSVWTGGTGAAATGAADGASSRGSAVSRARVSDENPTQ